jgi:predicted dehydrogenase
VEDVAMLTLRFERNVIAFIHVSWLDPDKIRRTMVVGSRKMLVYDDTAPQENIRIYDKGVTAQKYYDTFGEFQFSYRYGDIQIPRIEEKEPLYCECTTGVRRYGPAMAGTLGDAGCFSFYPGKTWARGATAVR